MLNIYVDIIIRKKPDSVLVTCQCCPFLPFNPFTTSLRLIISSSFSHYVFPLFSTLPGTCFAGMLTGGLRSFPMLDIATGYAYDLAGLPGLLK